jgi:hypothetical protein
MQLRISGHTLSMPQQSDRSTQLPISRRFVLR